MLISLFPRFLGNQTAQINSEVNTLEEIQKNGNIEEVEREKAITPKLHC